MGCMMKLKALNKKEASKILEHLGEEYGCDAKTLLIDKYTFFTSDKNKVYIITNEIKDIDLSAVRVNSFGMYLCEINHGNIRLSMEGSLLIGKIATKNVFEVDNTTAKEWLMGTDIKSEQEFVGFVIIKKNEDFLGCGKYKEGIILNYVSKARRIKE